jgi:hypothetical protein
MLFPSLPVLRQNLMRIMYSIANISKDQTHINTEEKEINDALDDGEDSINAAEVFLKFKSVQSLTQRCCHNIRKQCGISTYT